MSKIGDAVMQFLDNGGFELGYTEREMPSIDDMDYVLSQNIKVWEYKGCTEKQYYGS